VEQVHLSLVVAVAVLVQQVAMAHLPLLEVRELLDFPQASQAQQLHELAVVLVVVTLCKPQMQAVAVLVRQATLTVVMELPTMVQVQVVLEIAEEQAVTVVTVVLVLSFCLSQVTCQLSAQD
jgi:hypothetical protein